MRRGIDREEGFSEGQVVESWSGKKILAACIILVFVGIGGYYLFQQAKEKASKVLGAQVVNSKNSEVKLPSGEDATKLLETAKKELSSLTPDNLTASDAALQKIILDLQSLQKGKGNPVETFCNLVCKK